jgi:hypothetical protein
MLKTVHTPMVDATTDRVLAWVTRTDGPSTETLVQLLTHCVKRNQTIPTCIIVDWGPDFRSEWLQETLGAILRTTIIYRPKATGASGTPVEGKFRVLDVRSTHRMSGSTEIMRRARLVTAPMLPNKHAIWTLKDLEEHYERYYDDFNSAPYGTQKQSPNEREQELSKIFGDHPRNVIPLEVLERALLPYVKNVSRIVDKRCRIFVGRSYYASDALSDVRGEEVKVRQKPGDLKVVYVSHPKLKGIVECYAVSLDLKYAATPAEAVEVVAQKNLRSPEAEKLKHDIWAANVLNRHAMETRLRRRKRRSEKVASEPVQQPAPDNVVEFTYSQGGLTNLRSMEGDK